MRCKGVPHAVKGNDFGDASPGAGFFFQQEYDIFTNKKMHHVFTHNASCLMKGSMKTSL
jgi:hypothetical protein